MEKIHDCIIASHRLRLRGAASDMVAMGLRGFAPFEMEPRGDALLEVDTACELMLEECDILTEFDFEEGQARCAFGRNEDYWVLRIASATQPEHIFLYDRHTKCARTNAGVVGYNPSFMRFGLWFVFNIATVQHLAAAVHSSVIVKDGRAVMFLGESGTGKSTHTRLWRENIAGWVVVYGSPWSGKTPCYKAESYPLLAVVRLSQAPHNRIRPLKGVQAIGALLPSLPPAFAFDRELEEHTLATLSAVLRSVKAYHLECLPNGEAARLSCETVFGDADK